MAKRTRITRKERPAVEEGIRKMIREYKRTGKITTSRAQYRPRTLKEAVAQASAIEYGRVRGKRRKG